MQMPFSGRAQSASFALAGVLFVAGCLFVTGCGPSLVPVAAPAASTPAEALIADGFVALGRHDAIVLYKRERPSGFELAGEGDIPAPPERVRRVLLDYPGYKKWQDHLAECNVVGKGDDWLDVYQRLGLAVIDDRDYTLHVTWGDDAGTLWTKFETTTKSGPPPVDGVVRMHAYTGGWRLAPIQSGAATHAVYRFYIDLETDLTKVMGTGQAESGVVQLFADVTAQLPNYP
jgi:hypothetical protein